MASNKQLDQATAAASAAALIKATAESTAMALNVQYIQRDITDIKAALKEITNRDESYVQKEEFTFWRNLLVSGLFLNVAAGVIFSFLK